MDYLLHRCLLLKFCMEYSSRESNFTIDKLLYSRYVQYLIVIRVINENMFYYSFYVFVFIK